MYHFEGQFRRKPVQALGGASGTEDKSVLLSRARQERQKREVARRETEASIVIQSTYRSHVDRKNMKEELRHQYDQSFSSIASRSSCEERILLDCLKFLNFFYSDRDTEQLVELCQYCIRHKASIFQFICTSPDRWCRNIRKLLVNCCRFLKTVSLTGSNITSALRMLEIYTDASQLDVAAIYIQMVLVPLYETDMYETLRRVLDARVPESVQPSARPPTPLADLIFRLTVQPLLVMQLSQRRSCLVALNKSFFARRYTPPISDYMLFALAESQSFPVRELLQAIDYSDGVAVGPFQLHSIMTLMQPKLAECDDATSWRYVRFISENLATLEPATSRRPTDDDSDSEDEGSDVSMSDSLEAELKKDCMKMLMSGKLEKLFGTIENNIITNNELESLCRLCHQLLYNQRQPVHGCRILSQCAYNSKLLRRLWEYLTSLVGTSVAGTQTALVDLLARGGLLSAAHLKTLSDALDTFCSLFSHFLVSLYDTEFYDDDAVQSPFSLRELVSVSSVLRGCCLGLIEAAHPETRPFITSSSGYNSVLEKIGVVSSEIVHENDLQNQLRLWSHLFRSTSAVLRQLYTRDLRRPFCPHDHWTSPQPRLHTGVKSQLFRAYQSVDSKRPFGTFSNLSSKVPDDDFRLSTNEARTYTILTELPFIVHFRPRLEIYTELLLRDKAENQGDMHHFGAGKSIRIQVRRNFLYEDAFEKLSLENEPDLRLHMQVQLKNFAGLDEAGIDGGGLFREFMSELLKSAFDPNRGLFIQTVDQLLYPNPAANLLFSNYQDHYFFLGRMLGKALYENMLVELPFANFFLAKLLSRYHGDLDIHHLQSLDPELYKNLLSLKEYRGNLSEMGLDFTFTVSEMGENKIIELIPDGRNTPLTNENLTLYLHKVADFKLNKEIRAQCTAFRAGLGDVMKVELLRMFDATELQTLISGAEIPIDLQDLRANTNYAGGYSVDDAYIASFWDVVSSFSDDKKRSLLKFVTSCSRPPILGFKDLVPPFCIQWAGNDADRLPTASTCMNLLKLPKFPDKATLQRKLDYALDSGAGFELS